MLRYLHVKMDKSIEKIALPVISALTKKKIFYFGIHLSPNQHGNNFEHRKHASITDHGLSRIYSSEFPTSIYLEIKVGTKNVSLSFHFYAASSHFGSCSASNLKATNYSCN